MTRFGYVLVTVLAAELFAGLFIAVAILDPLPRFIWNASASAPIGLYTLHRTDDPPIGALVAVAPPAPLAGWLAERHYLPKNVPLLKHVVATAGQRVCRTSSMITVAGQIVGKARERDSRGRALPVWKGCRTLRTGELFLMNPAVPDSLDGRYFGPLPASTLLGRATPMLTRDVPGASLRWRGFQP
ncbi:S26 family signal peptidase [Sphingobium aquiterrae]|uniref:S26 family signal peptidase n=1 Tax=Sphingobium aquiterrae TaxID=2038656 RepID=UPI003015F3FC